MHEIPWAAIVPPIVIGVAFVCYCLIDLFRGASAKYLPRWAWAVICCISVPLGGVVYLVFGRGER